MMKDNPKCISKELFDLLYDIKELAIEQEPINVRSFLNSFDFIGGYTTYVELFPNNCLNIDVIKVSNSGERHKYYCEYICTINARYLPGSDAVIITSCGHSNIKDFDYTVHNGKLIYCKYTSKE